ncbi:Ig-like domain-containing protein [Jidongwangia harbinensis]|uniref:Ig-like domain-containing protein n=1 Tax=Jidongwangia harbinensis TaxID=2878561 RepID=UPI001CD96AE7|nr:Ig-like domain-containing protein [Jidongwangia harbinensis]MCA2215062.1 Ig-like domain-containing protein [Jidongwangia harbinensis]
MHRRIWTVLAVLLLPLAGLAPAAPAHAAVTPVAKVNFQPAGSPVPSGWTADTGAAFDAARGSGWVRQDSLSGTRVPLDLTANTRDRARAGIDARLNTLIHLQYGDVGGTGGVLVPGAWEYTVPAGQYQVTVSVGDRPAYNSSHRVRVEGAAAITGFVSTADAEYRQATVTVPVTDGRLTVDATGGTNTKLNYVEIARVTADPPFELRVNFSDAATAPPTGYLRDSGGAYSAARGYGWVDLGERTPVDLTGNGRNRTTSGQADVRLATFMHAQLPAGSPGVTTPGAWEAAVPNGLYRVTVAVGDAGTATNSAHWASVEDQNAVAAFVPTASVRHATVTRTVRVTDGKLTLSPAGGTNTKFHYIDIASVPGAETIPAVRAGAPANGATGVSTTTSVVADLVLPNGGVAPGSLTASTVTLTRLTDGAAVPANRLTSGGGDVVNLSPTAALAANTAYRFTLTSGVTDVTGAAFAPYSMVFTTGSGPGPGGPVAFEKTVGVATGAAFTTVLKGPDGRLYAGTLDGRIFRFPINAGGTLGTPAVITTVRDNAAALGLPGAPARTVIGMAFDPASTAAAPVLWITDNYQYTGTANVPDWTGRVGRLSGPDLGTYTQVLVGLPRSVKDHETNSLAFGPDGAIYLSQGSNNAMGAPDSTWANRPERRLSAAVLRLDPARLPATLPLNVKTEDGGSYDPYAAGAALTLHATGVRNAFDLVWHRNGHLYAPTNGSAAGGNTPATPNPLPAACTRRGYTGPAVPALTGVPTAETDYVFDVRPGRYYGHPNPGRCEWVLAGGNPTAGTDPFEVPAYPVGTLPDVAFDLAGTYDAGLHASANGVIEYRGSAFGGALDGKLLVVRYSAGQDIQTFDVAASGALSNRTTGLTGLTGFSQPLDVTEDLATGYLYVTELGANRITLLKPR